MTETGRTSTNVLKPPLRPTKVGMTFQTIPRHGPFSKDIRSIFVPPEGHIFIEVDKKQAEARIVAHLADDKELLKSFDESDPYKEDAADIFHKAFDEIKEDERFIAKTGRLSAGYDVRKHRLMTSINTDSRKFGLNISISEKEADIILIGIHRRSPKIRAVFHAEIRRCLKENNRTLINPYGRRRTFYGRPGEETDKEAFAQIPQSTVPDDLRYSGLSLHREAGSWLHICLEAHDSFLFKCPIPRKYEAISLIKRHFQNPIDFSKCSIPRGLLTIPIEIKVGINYGEMRNVEHLK